MRLTPPCVPPMQFVPLMQRCSPSRLNVVETQQTSAWLLENELSPHGEKEYSEVFDGVNYRDFTINFVDCGNEAWECSVTRGEAYGNHTKGTDEGIVLWTMHLWIG